MYCILANSIAHVKTSVYSSQQIQLHKRNGSPIEGQPFYAALERLLDTSLTVGTLHIALHPRNQYLIVIITATCPIFNL